MLTKICYACRFTMPRQCQSCSKRSTWGLSGGPPLTCAEHKEPCMVNVWNKRCDFPGSCSKIPSFGPPGSKAALCSAHKEPGMVNVHAKLCGFPGGCDTHASFGPLNGSVARCSAHKEPGMVDKKNPSRSSRSVPSGPPAAPTDHQLQSRPQQCPLLLLVAADMTAVPVAVVRQLVGGALRPRREAACRHCQLVVGADMTAVPVAVVRAAVLQWLATRGAEPEGGRQRQLQQQSVVGAVSPQRAAACRHCQGKRDGTPFRSLTLFPSQSRCPPMLPLPPLQMPPPVGASGGPGKRPRLPTKRRRRLAVPAAPRKILPLLPWLHWPFCPRSCFPPPPA